MNSRSKLLALGCALGIAGCAQGGVGGSGALPPSGLSTFQSAARAGSPGGRVRRQSASDPTIYIFQGYPDATTPQVNVVNIGSIMYGTTYSGGASNNGALYSVTTGGAETVMHSFPTGSNDGLNPASALVVAKGKLYGTTYYGGTNGKGVLFSMTPSGSYKVLYNFGATSTDCAQPLTSPSLTYVPSKNAFYGVTYHGGMHGEGCIFKYSLGKNPGESVVYSFTGSASSPTYASGLVYFKGALYGTTPQGGANDAGSVFKVTLAGKESIVYSFKGEPDGAGPAAPLVVDGDALYGTAEFGGQGGCGGYAGCGIIFKLTAAGKETVLYRFKDVVSVIDAANPQSALTVVGGELVGTASCTGNRCGSSVLYSESPSGGNDTILYDFTDVASSPSGYPVNALWGALYVNGHYYGVSSASIRTGYGTVWAL